MAKAIERRLAALERAALERAAQPAPAPEALWVFEHGPGAVGALSRLGIHAAAAGSLTWAAKRHCSE